ncbi:hypothetical protein Gorai_012645 [Gossypium raimondii]|uniref:Uncharacterized protein n=1 Tax=Gossypium raimondii TaxID=29730 RepID=A0A7J8Q2V7_GOSRA|nr:hypothetical protein [Gossypium raimondii]
MADPVVASHLSLVLKAHPTISSPSQFLLQQHSKPMASSLNSAASLRLFASSSSSSSAAARLSLRSTSLSFSSSLKSLAFSTLSRHKRGSAVSVSSTGGFSSVASPKCAASDPDQLKSAREDIKELLKSKFCHPILVWTLLRFVYC